jgi:hypothetical protein
VTATLPRGGLRTEAQLIRALAREVRVRPVRDFDEALHEVMHGESKQRWQNFVAALGLDLHLKPINGFDEDSSLDHPACYAERLRIWAARLADPARAADALEALANAEEHELTQPLPGRARVGGSAYVSRLMGGVPL